MAGRWMKIYAAREGAPAGSIHTDHNKGTSYALVPHGLANWFAHRVIWMMHYGYLDNEYVVDHIDENSLNNTISNLRVVKQVVNNRNASIRKDNNTGTSGVHFTTARGANNIVHTYATATWYTDKGRMCKHFATSKLGLLEAFAMDCAFREQKIKELNELGYGYTENHGK